MIEVIGENSLQPAVTEVFGWLGTLKDPAVRFFGKPKIVRRVALNDRFRF